MQGKRVVILCLASYFKGTQFLVQAKAEGAHVVLLTRQKLADKAWPDEAIDERFLMPTLKDRDELIRGVSYLARERDIAAVVALDDYDVLMASELREHLRLRGLSSSRARFFRDKLAMRVQAQACGIAVPAFTAVHNHGRLAAFMEANPAPWVLKPRLEAGGMGIKRVNSADAVWRWLHELGDEQSYFLLESFLPGHVYHVDSIVWDGEVIFTSCQVYGRPPIEVAHDGGVFMSQVMDKDSAETLSLTDLNAQIIRCFGMQNGVTHTEFIRSDADGEFYFLETAARVGGASVDKLIEAASGVNLWAEWARLEVALARGETYRLPELRSDYAGILVCLAKQRWPDMENYSAEAVWWTLKKAYHAGLVVRGESPSAISSLLDTYARRFAQDFLAIVPPLDRAPE